MDIPSYVTELMDVLEENGYECFIVGGALRSALLSLPVKDYDLTTNALPEEIKHCFTDYKTIDTGIQHGTVTVLSHHHPIEITTYRVDAPYEDHRHPSGVIFTRALKEDCARRDFTINAVCADRNGRIMDFFGGREDMKNRKIRAIGYPEKRFDEDALRILRALRFASVLTFTIETETDLALRRKKDTLAYVSAERISAELKGLLEGRNRAAVLVSYREVFEVFLPQLKDVDEVHMEKMISALSLAPQDASVNMALFLSESGMSDPEQILKDLKYSNADIRMIMNLIELRDMPCKTKIDMRRLRNRLQCPFEMYLAYRCACHSDTDKEKVSSLYEETANDCTSLKDLAIRGNDVTALGIKGPQIGQCLEAALHAVMEDRVINEHDALLAWLKDQSIF